MSSWWDIKNRPARTQKKKKKKNAKNPFTKHDIYILRAPLREKKKKKIHIKETLFRFFPFEGADDSFDSAVLEGGVEEEAFLPPSSSVLFFFFLLRIDSLARSCVIC